MEISKDEFLDGLRTAILRLEAGGHLEGGELGRLVAAVTGLEVEEGGPYAWAQDGAGSVRADADVGLNLLIAYFLSLLEVRLPRLEMFLDAELATGVSAFISAEEQRALADKWRARRMGEKEGAPGARPRSPEEERMMELILAQADERFAALMPELKEFARSNIEKTMRGNGDGQMSLMAFYMRQALGGRGSAFSDELVARMGLCNVFFWTAFVIYDDFWDEDEAADPRILPTANLFARSFTEFFDQVLPAETGWRDFFHGLMDQLDGANTWETVHCRARVAGARVSVPERLPAYGDYEAKYLPAAGHLLGPVALLVMLGFPLESPQVRGLISYFRHYLIARQLADDMHDWEEDLRRGHLSTVVVMLLEDFCRTGELDLDAELAELRQIFWSKTIPRAARTAITHADAAEEALEALALEDPAPLRRLADRTRAVAERALREQADSAAFLDAYAA